MHEQRLGRAADPGAPHLGVDDDLQRLVEIRRPIDIDMHDAFEMGEHRHARLTLNPLDQAFSPARHDHVERAAEALQHLADRLAGGEGRACNRSLRQTGFLQARDQAGVDRGRRAKTVGAAAQHHRIAALEAQRASVSGHIGPALVDNADDPERRRHALDNEAIGTGIGREHTPDRIGQGCDLLEAKRHRLDPSRIEREPVDQGRAQVLRAGVRAIEFIGGQNLAHAFAQNARARHERAIFLLRRRVGDLSRGDARLRPDFAHCSANLGFRLDNLNDRHKLPEPRPHS